VPDDWRIRIEVEEDHAGGLLERLGAGLGAEARELARDLENHRLAVTRDEDTVFVYASSRAAAEQAKAIVEAELREHGIEARTSSVEHWLHGEQRWDGEPPAETWEEEELDRGWAPWEVRIEARTRDDAGKLAAQLESEGYKPQRQAQYVIVGTANHEDAVELSRKLGGEVEPGGELVWEVAAGNPFAVFGGMGL